MTKAKWVCLQCKNTEDILEWGYCPKCGPTQIMNEKDYNFTVSMQAIGEEIDKIFKE